MVGREVDGPVWLGSGRTSSSREGDHTEKWAWREGSGRKSGRGEGDQGEKVPWREGSG